MDSKNISDVFCPSCGAPARFDIISQQYKCSHCDGNVKIREAISQKLGFRKLHQQRMKDSVHKYKLFSASCSGCGATVVFEENESMATCAFCGKSLVRKEYAHDEELPEMIIPFRITEDEARKIAKDWCDANRGKAEARHLSEKIPEIKGFYLPYELIRGPIHCKVSRQDSKAYDCGGNVDKEFINLSKQLDNLLLDAMEPFELSDLTEFDFSYVAGQRVKTSDITSGELENRMHSELSTNLKPQVKKTFHTPLLNINVNLDSILRMPVLLPVYYVCCDNLMAAINGQTGKVSVRAEKDSYTYYMPWLLKALLSTLIICLLAFNAFIFCGWDYENSCFTTGALGLVIGIITLCFFSETEHHSFRELAARKVFTSKGGPYRRNSNNKLEKDKKELVRSFEPPVYFYNIKGKQRPVELSFLYSFLFLLTSGLLVLFFPVIVALFLNGFNFQQLTLSGSAVWFCIFVPVVPIFILKFGIVYLYDEPWIYLINEDGSKTRYKSEKPIITFETLKEFASIALVPPGCLATGFALMCVVMCCYLTAFGYGDEEKEANKAQNTKTAQVETLSKTEQKTTIATTTVSVTNTKIATATAKITLAPLKQQDFVLRSTTTKELINFFGNQEQGYYGLLHFNADQKNDWNMYSHSISNDKRVYLFYNQGDSNREKVASVVLNKTGFDVFDKDDNLIWTIEEKANEYWLEKGKDRELAYRMYKLKSNSELFNCYMVVDPSGQKKGLSLTRDKLIVMSAATKETVFYSLKNKLNKANEPALAFPNIFLLDEMSLEHRCIIALELSQLE